VPCLLLLLFLAFPRVILVLLFLFTNFLGSAYHSLIVPILGFIFVPVTTLVYAWILNGHYPLAGSYLLILLIALAVDVSAVGGGEYRRRQGW
jgi:drug/metabolite transporter (DMT)-like permease